MALPFFAITLFVSAFLLFLIQPMIGKMILPRLGGTPQVWNTCMVFFQMALLAGYAYTHTVSSRLKLRQQLLLHGVLLFVPLLVLTLPGMPFDVRGWTPPPGANPIPATLLLLTLIVGLPFFVVATSAPLLQRWFSNTGHSAAQDPYFLYGASNLGSLLALIAYPFLVEPFIGLTAWDPDNPDKMRLFSQPWVWTFGYMLLIVLVLGCGSMVWGAPASVQLAGAGGRPSTPAPEHTPPPAPTPESQPQPETAVKSGPPGPGGGGGGKGSTAIKKGSKQKAQAKGPQLRPQARKDVGPTHEELARLDHVTPWRRVRWVLLAAIPSSLMLGVTNFITTDLSPIPLFWLIPLTLYLLSFILVFARWPVVWTREPHTVMVYAQPIALALLLWSIAYAGHFRSILAPILLNVLAFFATTMVCHGELAKDRPGTKHLTEFYLWMSVGGMLGGMFNGLVAPLMFWGLAEFPLAIFAAGLVRPQLQEGGWADTFFANAFAKTSEGAKPGAGGRHVRKGEGVVTDNFAYGMDVVLPFALLVLIAVLVFGLRTTISQFFGKMSGDADSAFTMTQFVVFGIPLIISCFYLGRPLRYGLAIGAILLVHEMYVAQNDSSIYSDRSYFGILRVKADKRGIIVGRNTDESPQVVDRTFHQLIHGHINHGMNFVRPERKEDWGNPKKDFSRLPTTYYHRLGPAGIVMEQYCWFHEPMNEYRSDARMPASLVGLAALPSGGLAAWPAEQMVALWSEPPYATIGLGTGTMAAYSRPFQHMHYYEIDNHIRRLSLPTSGVPYFNYLSESKARGAEIWVLMGDARLKMAQPYEGEERDKLTGAPLKGGGPDNFYHMMVVDAFTSDAIPVHLITKEAIRMYFDKLVKGYEYPVLDADGSPKMDKNGEPIKRWAKGGILCVHTSNRYVNLVPVVADVAASLGYKSLRGHDNGPLFNDLSVESAKKLGEDRAPVATEDVGHFTSEWVMVARDSRDFEALKEPGPELFGSWLSKTYREAVQPKIDEQKKKGFNPRNLEAPYWTTPAVHNRYVWTDDYSNLMSVFREFNRHLEED